MEKIILIIILASFCTDLLFGEFPSPIHPVVWMGKLIERMKNLFFQDSKYIDILSGILITISLIFIFVLLFTIILIFSSFNLILFLTGLQTLQMGCSMVVLSAMTADTIEYAEWKTGQRNEGLIMSTQTFITKIGIAITGAISAGILSAANYIPNGVQTQSTLSAFHLVVTILPGIIGIFACIPLIFYDLTEEKHEQIVKEIEDRKMNNITSL